MAHVSCTFTLLTSVLMVTTFVDSYEVLMSKKFQLCVNLNANSQSVPALVPCASAGATGMYLQGQQYVTINDLCLSSYGYNYYPGARFILWQCLNQGNQLWQSTIISQEERTAQIKHIESGMCLSASGACGQFIDMQICASNPVTTNLEQVWIATLL